MTKSGAGRVIRNMIEAVGEKKELKSVFLASYNYCTLNLCLNKVK